MESYSSIPDTLTDLDTSLSISESLVPIRDHKPAQVSSVSFDGLLKNPLLLKEDLREGCGGQLWPAGMVLTKYLLRQRHLDFCDKTMFVFPSLHQPFFFLSLCGTVEPLENKKERKI